MREYVHNISPNHRRRYEVIITSAIPELEEIVHVTNSLPVAKKQACVYAGLSLIKSAWVEHKKSASVIKLIEEE